MEFARRRTTASRRSVDLPARSLGRDTARTVGDARRSGKSVERVGRILERAPGDFAGSSPGEARGGWARTDAPKLGSSQSDSGRSSRDECEQVPTAVGDGGLLSCLRSAYKYGQAC